MIKHSAMTYPRSYTVLSRCAVQYKQELSYDQDAVQVAGVLENLWVGFPPRRQLCL